MRRLTACLAFLPLAACSFGPVVTTNPLDAEEAGGQVVSVCYTSYNTTREEVMALAEERCSVEGSSVEVWKTNLMLNECPVFLKRRVAFVCVPPADQDAKVRAVAPLTEQEPPPPGAAPPGTTEPVVQTPSIVPPAGVAPGPGY